MNPQKITMHEIFRRIDDSLLKRRAEVYGTGFNAGGIRYSRIEKLRKAVKESSILRNSPFLMRLAKGVYQSMLHIRKW